MKLAHAGQFVIALAIAVGIEWLVLDANSHGISWWTHVPGFFALFGFVVCLVLAYGGKALGRIWLQRDEHYYRYGGADDD